MRFSKSDYLVKIKLLLTFFDFKGEIFSEMLIFFASDIILQYWKFFRDNLLVTLRNFAKTNCVTFFGTRFQIILKNQDFVSTFRTVTETKKMTNLTLTLFLKENYLTNFKPKNANFLKTVYLFREFSEILQSLKNFQNSRQMKIIIY